MKEENSVRAELVYRDPDAALEWLEKAFGFETRIIVKDPDGRTVFSESGYGEHTVGIVSAAIVGTASPADVGGLNTQIVQVRSSADVEACGARARAERQKRTSSATRPSPAIRRPCLTFDGRLLARRTAAAGLTVRFPGKERPEDRFKCLIRPRISRQGSTDQRNWRNFRKRSSRARRWRSRAAALISPRPTCSDTFDPTAHQASTMRMVDDKTFGHRRLAFRQVFSAPFHLHLA
jgi:uncharacterized glyoxalase superfamily protein PhnB